MTSPNRAARRQLPLLLLAIAITGVAHSRMDTSTRADGGEHFVPEPERARVASLGFRALVADAYWLQAVQIVGADRAGTGGQEAVLGRLVDVVTTVDPWVDHPYRFAAVWLTDSPESVRTANRLLERGISYHPTDWRNRHLLGFNHFFYLEDSARAAEILETAVPLPDSPRYLGALVARLRAEGGGLEMAAQFLLEQIRDARDEYARAEYLKALDAIETERAARFLDEAREEYFRRNGRDIERVADLLEGPRPVLRVLPPAHTMLEGFAWELDPESGQIVSSFYGSRYRIHVHPRDAERQERWRREAAARRAEGT